MKILFVSRGKLNSNLSPIILSQGHTFERLGHTVKYYAINGIGLMAYFSSIISLRKYLNSNSFDIIHAHYGLSGIVATLAGSKPLVVSLMGSDVNSNILSKYLVKFFYHFFWRNTIAKSKSIVKNLNVEGITIIPNGVDLSKFNEMDQADCQAQLEWDSQKTHILFAADPKRSVKNFPLAENAVKNLNRNDIELHYLQNLDSNDVPVWMNAADVILLTSTSEGSPNVIKEAMACNRPIVSTKVGDVPHVVQDVDGCYLVDFDVKNASIQIERAIVYSTTNKKTKGRGRIIELKLDDNQIGQRLLQFYKESVDSV